MKKSFLKNITIIKMLRKEVLDRIFWAFIAFTCVLYGYLLIPNYDDGQYFYHIYNTIRFYNPFYNDYFGQYFHFMKPTTILYALLYSISGNTSFRLIALIQSVEIFVCTWLMYLCARRYASEEVSKAGALMFLYLVLAHYWLTPTRPETTVLLCSIAVFWLCECFSATNKTTYLVIASAIVFLIAIPMHTNGSIPLIYLILYTLTRRHQLSRISLSRLGVFSVVLATLGFVILVYPNISSLAESLALFSYDSKRFDMFQGEYRRIKWFVRHYYFFPWVVFIVSVFCGCLFHGYRELKLTSFQKYLNIILFLLAVVLGLGVLPSATHGIYTVYYYLPLVLGFSIAFDFYARRDFSHYLKRLILVVAGVLTLWYSYGIMPKLHNLLYTGPFFLTAVLIRRISAMQTMLIIVIPMLLFRTVGMVSSKIIYDRAEQKIKEAPGLVLANPLFNYSGKNVFPVSGSETQIRSSQDTTTIELKSVADEKVDKIKAHPLVKFFGSTNNSDKNSKWAARRNLGSEFQVIDHHGKWKISDYIESQVNPLNYSIINEIPLSKKRLDRYASRGMKKLKFIEYRCISPKP